MYEYLVKMPVLKPFEWENSRIAIYPKGGVSAYTSDTDIGQGTESTYAQVIVEILGIKMHGIRNIEGDSDITGAGPWSSRGATYGVSAAVKTAKLRREMEFVI
ncbi:MAG: molybdopterin cofactor-binding domain-containing protein [Conexivisphaerales archaeon]